jgi:hypothetical protein
MPALIARAAVGEASRIELCPACRAGNRRLTRIHPTTKRSTVLVGAFCCSR